MSLEAPTACLYSDSDRRNIMKPHETVSGRLALTVFVAALGTTLASEASASFRDLEGRQL
jgi:hypothetical protein